MNWTSCEQPVTVVTATVPAVTMLLSLVHVAACRQSSYAAPASSSLDPPPAGGHVDMLCGGTFVLTILVSVRVSRCQRYLPVRHHLLLHGQATHERVRARCGTKVVLPETRRVQYHNPVVSSVVV